MKAKLKDYDRMKGKMDAARTVADDFK